MDFRSFARFDRGRSAVMPFRRVIPAAFACLLITGSARAHLCPIAYSTPNILTNPNFTLVLPKDWTRDAYIYNESLFLFKPDCDDRESWRYRQQGRKDRDYAMVGISIPASQQNDARWIQAVDIQPNHNYILSGWIKTKDVTHTTSNIDVGANLSVLNWGSGQGVIDIYTPPLFGTNDWTYRQVKFNSGPHNRVTVALRVGFFSGTSSGTAWFRDVRLQAVP